MIEISKFNNKNVFVTGSHGFIGAHLMSLLRGYGALVQSCHTNLLTADLRGEAYDRQHYIFHLAARSPAATDPIAAEELLRDNVTMLQNVLEFALENRSPVVLVSSSHVYPKITMHGHAPLREEDVVLGEALSDFGLSKQACEQRALEFAGEYSLPLTIVRLPNIYGPGDGSHRFVPTFVQKCLSGTKPLEVMGSPEVLRDFMYVEDAARALLLAADGESSGKVYNMGSGSEQTMSRVAEAILKAAGRSGEEICYLDSSEQAFSYNVLDSTHATTALGFKAIIPLVEGIDKTVAWWREQK
jgi:nucleoside-diphosphate-sugar epimerase